MRAVPVRVVSRSAHTLCCVVLLLCVALSASRAPAATHTCNTSQEFHNVLAGTTTPALQLGDTIILNAANTFIPINNNFVLRNLTTGTGYVTIQSSALASLPVEGRRVGPGDAANMPDVRPKHNNEPAIKTAATAHHYKLVGLQFIGHATNGAVDGLIRLGDRSSAQNNISLVPYELVVDRCYFHANAPVQNIVRGIRLDSASTTIKGCYITDCHSTTHTESQAIHMQNGPGPYTISNNRLESAGENIMAGGAGTIYITNQLPSDILVEKNHIIVPIAWRGTYPMKNLFELKNGRRVTVRGNIFENAWSSGQTGIAINIKVAEVATNPWAATEDVLFEKNIVRNCGEALQLQGDDYGAGHVGPVRRLNFNNNLFYNVDHVAWGGAGYFCYFSHAIEETTIDHNTCFQSGKVILADGITEPNTNIIYKNNLTPHNLPTNVQGVKGSGTSTGSPTLTPYFPGISFWKNVLMAGNAANYSSHTGLWSPATDGFPASWTGVLANFSTPGSNFAGWKIHPTDPNAAKYRNAGVTATGTPDNKDIGCDIDAVVAATAGCITGVWSAPPQTVVFKNGVNGYSGSTSFMTKGSAPTSWFGPSQWQNVVNNWGGTNGSGIRSFYKFDVSSIPSGATITSATLKVRVTWSNNPTNPTMAIHRMAPVGGAFAVNYTSATRNTYNGTNGWTGGSNAAGDVANSNNDFNDTPDSTANLPAGGAVGDMTFTVTPSVQAWVNGTANNGWLILTSTATTTVYMGAPADLNGSVDFPELSVTYQQ